MYCIIAAVYDFSLTGLNLNSVQTFSDHIKVSLVITVQVRWISNTGHQCHSSHIPASTLCNVPAWIMTCQCFVFCHLSCHLVSSHILFHQISPSQLCGPPQFRFPSTVLSSVISFLWPHLYPAFAHVQTISTSSRRNSAIGYMCASFQMSTFLT